MKMRAIDEINRTLDMMSAVGAAVVGAMSKKGSEGQRAAERFRRDLLRRRDDLAGVRRQTIWDRLKGRSRKI